MNTIKHLESILYKKLHDCSLDSAAVAHTWYEDSFNFGDSAIWNGQVDALKVLNCRIKYQCSDRNYHAKTLKKSIDRRNTTILLRGGGNFGDLYQYHELRLNILASFPQYNIIQFPQTAYFTSSASIARTAKIISNQTNITLLARDEMTYELFQENFNFDNTKINLCPDMAFASGKHKRLSEPTVDIIGILRIDQESKLKGTKGKLYPSMIEAHVENSKVEELPFKVATSKFGDLLFKHYVLRGNDSRIELTDWYMVNILNESKLTYQALSDDLKAKVGLNLALKMLSRGKVVITDRLHAYILCLQLEIPHIVIDNSYGKLSSFHKTWVKNSPNTYFVDTFDEALDLANSLI